MATKKKTPARALASFDDLDNAGIGAGYQPLFVPPLDEAEPEKPAARGLLGAANDTVIELANAAAGGVKAVGDFVSPGNRISQAIGGFIEHGEESQSDVVKAEKRRFRDRVAAAQGIGDELAAVGDYVTSNPLLTASQAVGSFVLPGAAVKGASAGAKLLGAGARGTTAAGRAGGVAAGGTLAGGDAAGSAYELVMQTPIETLLQHPEAKALAANGANEATIRETAATAAARDASILPALIGAGAGAFGAERLLAGGAKSAGARGAARAVLSEGVQEGVEEGATQFEAQRAAAAYNPEIQPGKGVAAAAGMGAVLGGATGGGVHLLTPAPPPPKGPLSRAAASVPAAALMPVEQVAGDPQPGAAPSPAAQAPAAVAPVNTQPAALLGQGIGADPLQAALQRDRDEATTEQNLASWMQRAEPLALDHAQELKAAAAERGMDMEVVPHSAGQGYTVVPGEWMAPSLRGQTAQQPEAGLLPYDQTPTGVLRADAAGTVAPETRAQRIDSEQLAAQARAEAQRKAELGLTPDIEAVQAGAKREPLPTVQPGDLALKSGEPFKNRGAAVRAQKKAGGEVLQVQGGWVVRPEGAGNVGTADGAGAVAAADGGQLGDVAAAGGGDSTPSGRNTAGRVGDAAGSPAGGRESTLPVRDGAGESATAVAATPNERWSASDSIARENVLLAAGWKAGSPGLEKMKSQAWDKMTQGQRNRVAKAMTAPPSAAETAAGLDGERGAGSVAADLEKLRNKDAGYKAPEDMAAALRKAGAASTSMIKETEWQLRVGDMGEVNIDFDPVTNRAKVVTNWEGKDVGERDVEGVAAIREAIEDARGKLEKAEARRRSIIDARKRQKIEGPAAADKTPLEEQPGSIQDAGEKIGGARKDRWKERGLAVADLDAMSDSEGAELAVKQNVWKPDYAAMVAGGATAQTAASVKIVYDRLAAKPKADTPAGRHQYVQMMQHVREVYGAVKTEAEFKAAKQELLYGRLKWPLGDAGSNERARANAEGVADLQEVIKRAKALLFSVYKGRSDPFYFDYSDGRKAAAMVAEGFPAKVEPWKTRLVLRAYDGRGVTEAGMRIYREESAQLGTPLTDEQIRAGFVRVTGKDGKTRGYFPTKEHAEAGAKSIYERELQAARDDKKEPDRPHLDTLKRDGLPPRIDRNVTAEDMISHFGFRGVEFGNWSAQDERQRILNMAYDGLSDLSEIMGVPPKAMSLNGTLGMAFGARGSGKALAHYEPGKLVINMTKLRGGGSLAHEWAHALDHYFGELDQPDAYKGKARGASGWYAEGQYNGVPITRHERQTDGTVKKIEKTRLANLRPELAAALDRVMSSLFQAQITKAEMLRELEASVARAEARAAAESDPQLKKMYESGAASQRQNLEETRKDPDDKTYPRGKSEYAKEAGKLSGKGGRVSSTGYWLRPTEMFARAFESWVFDRVVAMGARSDYLVHGVEEDRFAGGSYKGNPYPVGKERAAVNAAFEKLAATIKTRETPRGVAMFMRKVDPTEIGGEMALPQLRKAALSWAEKHLAGKTFSNADSGAEIQVTRAGIKHGLNAASPEELRILPALPDLLEGAKLVRSDPDRRGRPDIKAVHTYEGAAQLGDKALAVRLLVREHRDGQRYYDHAVLENKDPAEAGSEPPGGTSGATSRETLGDQPAPGDKPIVPPFKRTATAAAASRVAGLQGFYDTIASKWANAPKVVVVRDIGDARVPAEVRDQAQASQLQGAEGSPVGFVWDSTVYIVADQVHGVDEALTVFAHEALGHYGLQGLYGEALGPIKAQIVAMRRKEVLAKVKAYGLDATNREHLLYAAEEVLAEMAQNTPTLGYVRRAIAAIKTWLREHVPGFKGMQLTDDEIIQRFILPAREWVVRGGPAAKAGAAVQFMRSDAARDQSRWQAVTDTEFGPEYSGAEVQLLPLGERDTSSDLEERSLPLGHAAHVTPGNRVFDFSIVRSGAIVGDATLEVDAEGNIEAVHDIVVSDRRAGTGQAVMEAILASAPGRVRIIDIVPTAVPFWDRMGAGARDVYENASTSWGDFQAARAQPRGKGQGKGAAAQEPGEARRAGAGPDQGKADPPLTRFSRGAAGNVLPTGTPLRAAIMEAMQDTFQAPGKLGWWHKTIGTQYNLAQRNPQFKRVFDSVQDFLHDVSRYATEAADMAPQILPKLETWRDIGKSPIAPEDNRAVSAPIFEGTLLWARDERGQPVKVEQLRTQAQTLSAEAKAQRMLRAGAISENVLKMWKGLPIEQYEAAVATRYESQMLRAGIVWTDAELRSQFGLTDDQVGLYKEFRASVDRSITNMAISDMLRFGGADVVAARQEALDAGDVDVAALVLRDHLLQLAEQQPDRSEVLIDTANRMVDKAERARELIERGYAPLSRFGHYTVDVVDENGDRVYFGMFETSREAALMARKMRGNFPRAEIHRGTVSEEEYKLFAGVSPETVELFGELLGLEAQGDDAASKAFQTYVKVAKANRSAMKRLIERKGIAGFSEDVGRVLAGFVYSNARQTSQNLHMGEMTTAATEVTKGDGELKDQATRLVEYIKNPQEEAQAFRGLLFAQYLGGSVASALVNMLQPVQVTFPYLSQFGGAAKAAGQMKRALVDVTKKSTGDATLDQALKKAEEEGIVAPQEVHQLMAQARGRGVLKSGDGTALGNAQAKASNALSRLTVAWGKLFGAAEQFNRRVTFIAAFRTAVDQGIGNPAAFAEKAIAETQFIYNKGNKPEWARGAVGGTIFTFKQYSISYVELLHRLATSGPDGRRAALLMLGMLFLMGGAGGLPFAEDLDDVADAVMQRLGYNFSAKLAKKQFFEKYLGRELGRFAEQGLSGLPGVPIDVSGRLGLGNLIPGTGLLVDKQDHARDVLEVAGVGGDFIARIGKGVNKLAQGDLFGATKEVVPRAALNVAKGAEMYTTGQYRDDKGRKVIDVDAFDAAMKTLGFQPTDVAKVQEATGLQQKLIGQNKLAEARIAERWARAVADGDQEELAAARAEVVRWNKNNPQTPIRINRSQIARRVKALREDKATRIGRTAPKEIRERVRRELEPA